MNIFTAKAINFQKGNEKPPAEADSKPFELDLEEELLLQQHLEQQLREDEERGDW